MYKLHEGIEISVVGAVSIVTLYAKREHTARVNATLVRVYLGAIYHLLCRCICKLYIAHTLSKSEWCIHITVPEQFACKRK